MCDEIIAKKPETFNKAYEIASTLEAVQQTAVDVKVTNNPAGSDTQTNKLGCSQPKTKNTRRGPNRSFSRGRGNSNSCQDQKSGKPPQRDRSTGNNNPQTKCQGCGANHARRSCPYLNASCHSCGIKGHIKTVCRKKNSGFTQNQSRDVHQNEPVSRIDVIHKIHSTNDIAETEFAKRHMLSVKIDGVNIEMELDSAAPTGIVSLQTMRAIKKNFRLLPTDRQFSDYSGHLVYCMGRVPVNVTLGSKTCRLNLYVVDGNYDSLFGRSWTEQFVHEIDFVKLFSGSSSEAIRALSTRSSALSADQSNSLGKLLSTLTSPNTRCEELFSAAVTNSSSAVANFL